MTGAEARTRALVDELTSPGAYPFPVESVERLETHISHLLFAGEFVYKIKKPVAPGFLDYTTLERRRHFCDEEVRLNLRLAEGVYLGVVPVCRGTDGAARIGGDGDVVEYAVRMRRLPAHRMMDAMLARGEIDNARLRALAKRIADFHAAAATGEGVDEHGDPSAVRRNAIDNFDALESFVGAPGDSTPLRIVGEPLLRHLRARTVEALDALEATMRERIGGGKIRDGHGDLHAGNVCFVDDRIVAYDCIEFSPAFRCGDVACDLAFLAMDLDRRCFRAMSAYLVTEYRRLSDDGSLDDVMGFYKGYRAMVRAKVGSLLAAQRRGAGDDDGAESARREAVSYLHLAATYTLPRSLILTCGLPASGKSYTASHVARTFEAAWLRSDVVRKRLYGYAPTETVPWERAGDVYGPAASARTYETLLEKSRRWLETGRTVVVDAVFGRAADREPFVRLAQELDAHFVVAEVVCPEETIRERMTDRVAGESVSDADFDVYVKLRDGFEPPAEIAGRVVLDGRMPAPDQVECILEALARRPDVTGA